MPVGREHWRLGLSLQGEFWAWRGLSVGARVGAELREEDLGRYVNASASPEGAVVIPQWSALDVHGSLFGSWAFTENFGVTMTLGHMCGRHVIGSASINANSWEGTLSVWFRTDGRLNRMWLDR